MIRKNNNVTTAKDSSDKKFRELHASAREHDRSVVSNKTCCYFNEVIPYEIKVIFHSCSHNIKSNPQR
jgi:hypothetical protein